MAESYIGTAGWNVPKAHAKDCVAEGSHLVRYASVLRCVEVNSSFHRPHQRRVWERWAAATPDDFRFAVKAPKTITHEAKLERCGALASDFFEQVSGLGGKLGPVLFQLPPRLEFDEGKTREFFDTVRELFAGRIVLEPRHASWFSGPVDRLLREFSVSRVAADPAKGSAAAAKPGGDVSFHYHRLHGSPRVYWSAYEPQWIANLAKEIRGGEAETWSIFDNTAGGAAMGNALELSRLVAT